MTRIRRLLVAVFIYSSLSSIGMAAPLSKPLFPVIFRVNAEGAGYPDYTPSELSRIADQSSSLWGTDTMLPTGNDLDDLRSQHPGYVVLAYLNGGHQGSWPETGPQLEDDRLDYIQVYRATTLTSSINATATQLSVASTAQIPVTGGAVNPRTAVRSLDGRTGVDGGFISFVRIDNEIVRVTAKATNPPTLTVLRGTDGTQAVEHAANANVLAPVYVTDYNPDGPETIQQGTVRYSLNVGTPQLARLLANNFVANDLRNGWDGVWLDITSPSFFNMVDALNGDIDGETRFPFNTVAGADYTLTTRASHHDLKVGRIQSAIQASFGRLPIIYVNNNGDGKWFADKGYGRRFAESNGVKVQPVDEVSLEMPFAKPSDAPPYYAWKGFSVWKKNARTVADATNRGMAICATLKMVVADKYVPENMSRPLGFSWASTMLSWGPNGDRSAVVLELWTASGNGRRINLPAFMYYDLGEPVGPGPATDDALDALLIGSSTYRRDWTQGVVLVNPTESSDSVSVSGYVDPGTCQPVDVKTMPAYSYKILMRPGAC